MLNFYIKKTTIEIKTKKLQKTMTSSQAEKLRKYQNTNSNAHVRKLFFKTE